MAKLFNLARVRTTTTGTGTMTLGAAVSGFLTFAQAGVQNGDVVAYAIRDGANSEIGYGTYTSSGTTLTRNVRKSTNSDAAISLSGNAEVLIAPSATEFVSADIDNTDTLALADDAADWLPVFDTSALKWKKVLGQNLGFTPAGTGAVLRSLQSKLRERFSVEDRGAVGDYTIGGSGTDSTAAIQAAWSDAITAGLGVLEFGPGTFLVTSSLSDKVILLRGQPGATRIVFKNMSAAIGFNMTASATVGRVGGSTGIEFIAEGANIAAAVKTPKDATQYSTYFTRYVFDRNYCRGANRSGSKHGFAYDFSAADWFVVGDCVGVDIGQNVIQGAFDIASDPSGQFEDNGIKFDAASAILTARMTGGLEIGPIYSALEIGDRVFHTLTGFDFIATYYGIRQTGTTIFDEPKIWGGNINAQHTGIELDGTDSRAINNVTIRRHSAGWKSASHAWHAILAVDCSDLKVMGCTAQPDESGGAFTGAMTAYSFEGCSLGMVRGNLVGVGCDVGVELDDTTGMVVTDTISSQTAAGDVLFDLKNDARRSVIGPYALVSTFAGTILQKDGTITGAISMLNDSFDLQGTGNINLDMTRVNAAADTKKWRAVVGTTSMNRQMVSDAGSGTNYELLTRSGVSLTSWERRATTAIETFDALRYKAGAALQTAQAAGNTLLLQAYDVNGAAYVTFGTLTANDTPTFDLAAAVTLGGNAILDTADIGSSVQAHDAELDAIAGLVSAADKLPYFTGSGTAAVADFTAAARTLVAGASARAMAAILGTWHILAASAVAVPHTGDTAETALATIALPANPIGANGVARITASASGTTSANDKILRVRLGGISGTILQSTTQTTNISIQMQTHIKNRNAQNSQTTGFTVSSTAPYGASTAAMVTATVDLSMATDLVISGQLEDGADTITLESYMVEIFFQT